MIYTVPSSENFLLFLQSNVGASLWRMMQVWHFKALFSFTAQSVNSLCAYLKSDLKSGAYEHDFWHQKYFRAQSSGVHKCDVETFCAQTQKLNFTAKLEDDSTTEWKEEEEEHQSEGMQPSALSESWMIENFKSFIGRVWNNFGGCQLFSYAGKPLLASM